MPLGANAITLFFVPRKLMRCASCVSVY